MISPHPVSLSLRLTAVTDLIAGRTLADIGTDHALVPIAACLSGRIDRAYACDIKPGPLAKANENIRAYGLDNKIETRLGDGLRPMAAGEADTLVMAGMGGMRIISILEESETVARSARRLVLQPQHDICRVRQALHRLRYEIADEHIIKEDGRFYWILAAQPHEKADTWTVTEYRLGRYPLARKDPLFFEFLLRETRKLTRYIEALTHAGASAETDARLAELMAARNLYESFF